MIELKVIASHCDIVRHQTVFVRHCRSSVYGTGGARALCSTLFFHPKQSEATVGGSYYGAPATITPPYSMRQNVKSFLFVLQESDGAASRRRVLSSINDKIAITLTSPAQPASPASPAVASS